MKKKTYKFLLKWAMNEIKEWEKFIKLLNKQYEKETTTK